MKKILVCIMAVCMLCACGQKERTTVCKGTVSGIEVVNTIKYSGEKANSIIHENTIEVEQGAIEYVKEYMDGYKDEVTKLSGVTYEYTVEGTKVVEKMTIDYTTADLSSLIDLGLIYVGEGEEEPQFVSYQLTIDSMTNSGLTCTEQE